MTYLTTSLVIVGEPPTIRTNIQRTNNSWDTPSRALGAVEVGGITIQTSGDPQMLRTIAAAFTTAADLMDEENMRIAAEGPQPTGGGYCPCGGVTDFYTDEDRTRWDELHAHCGDVA